MSQEAKDRIYECLKTRNPVLNLSNCGLSDLNEVSELYDCVHLTELYLIDNKIHDLRGLGSLSNLTRLELSNNQIVDVRELGKLINLTNLDLRNNLVVDVVGLSTLVLLQFSAYINS